MNDWNVNTASTRQINKINLEGWACSFSFEDIVSTTVESANKLKQVTSIDNALMTFYSLLFDEIAPPLILYLLPPVTSLNRLHIDP